MATPGDPRKPPASAPPRPAPAAPAPAGEVGLPAATRYTGPDPRVRSYLLRLPGPSDEVLEVLAHLTGEVPRAPVGTEIVRMLRGPLRLRLDLALPPGGKPLPAGGAQVFDLETALARFQERAYAVARVGPGVDLEGSTESTATGLQKVAWKLPRPC